MTRARNAGIKVSAAAVLGLGGKRHWEGHMRGTVEVLNACAADFASPLRLRLGENRVGDFIESFQRAGGDPSLPRGGAGIPQEPEFLLSLLKPASPVIFRSNRASDSLLLAGVAFALSELIHKCFCFHVAHGLSSHLPLFRGAAILHCVHRRLLKIGTVVQVNTLDRFP